MDQVCEHRLQLFTDTLHRFMTSMLPRDASCWDLEFDPEMKFLDNFISDSVCEPRPSRHSTRQGQQRWSACHTLQTRWSTICVEGTRQSCWKERAQVRTTASFVDSDKLFRYEYQAPQGGMGIDELDRHYSSSIFDTTSTGNITEENQLHDIAPVASFNDLLKAKSPQWGAKGTGSKWGSKPEGCHSIEFIWQSLTWE